MRLVGFSTGAVAYADFDRALDLLRPQHLRCVELSALRYREVVPLVSAIKRLNLRSYSYISVHAPSSFTKEEEPQLSRLLLAEVPPKWKIILHPDTIHDPDCWRVFGSRIAIENMDRRKPVGRSAEELNAIFDQLPEASFCFDIGHARQCDPSMTEAYRMLYLFNARLCQIHVSEVNSASQHERISYSAKSAFRQVAALIPQETPLIIESRVEQEEELQKETTRVLEAIPLAVPEPAFA